VIHPSPGGSQIPGPIKICRVCGIAQPPDNFFTRSIGKRSECKKCCAKKYREWIAKNPERRREIAREWNRRNRAHISAWRFLARRKDPKKFAKWNLENPEKKKAIDRLYVRANRGMLNAKCKERRTLKVKAFPKWANRDAITAIYKEAARLGLEVDHIVPLKHDLVCGLHVESNLQLLTVSENRRKSNIWPWPRP
jgi:hypothetical protein